MKSFLSFIRFGGKNEGDPMKISDKKLKKYCRKGFKAEHRRTAYFRLVGIDVHGMNDRHAKLFYSHGVKDVFSEDIHEVHMLSLDQVNGERN